MPARNLVAVVLWMTGALLSFCAMAVSVRVLAGTLSVMEILALRAGLGLAVMASLAATRADLRAAINSAHLPLHLFRNAVHVGSSYLWAMSLLLIPMAMTFALEFTTPAWALLIAAPVLGERVMAEPAADFAPQLDALQLFGLKHHVGIAAQPLAREVGHVLAQRDRRAEAQGRPRGDPHQ